MNNFNKFVNFISFHPDVDLVRNLFVDNNLANNIGIDKDTSVVFKLKNDRDIFVLNTDDNAFAITIVKVTAISNIIKVDDDDWIDDTRVIDTDWIGFIDNFNDIPKDHKLRKFADDLIRFADGDDWVDINHISIDADKHITTP